MGSGTYCFTTRAVREETLGYKSKSAEQIFTARRLDNSMDPRGVTVRESRDSAEHPNSLAIVLALDVTGSMGKIPHALVRDGLPKIMGGMLQRGVDDPQVLFLGVGDHECDRSPLQISQFESSDELLDKWLTALYLEGGGGGNDGESYMLAWHVAAKMTDIDCFNKRGVKGFLFTIGDEPVLRKFPAESQTRILGPSQGSTVTSAELLAMAREHYDVYHLHVRQGSNGERQDVISDWRDLIGADNLIVVDNHLDVPARIAEIVAARAGTVKPAPAKQDTPDLESVPDPIESVAGPDVASSDAEDML